MDSHVLSYLLRVPVPLDPMSTIVLSAHRLDLLLAERAIPELLSTMLAHVRRREDLVALPTARHSTSVLLSIAVPATLKHKIEVLDLKDASAEFGVLLQQFHELGHLPQLMDVCGAESD